MEDIAMTDLPMIPPDVDVDDLLPPEELVPLVQLDTAARILRAVNREEDRIETMEAMERSDALAWREKITKAKARKDALREMIRSWMLRTNTTKIQSPWLTASIGKGRTRLIIDDEPAAILAAENLGAHKCVKKSLVKSEFSDVFSARPDLFQDIAHEETGEPVLIVRKKE
jgi:hypothetical protein